MTATYAVHSFQIDRRDRVSDLQRAVTQELTDVGLNRYLEVDVRGPGGFSREVPSVGLYFGSTAAAEDRDLVASLEHALDGGLLVIPVVDDLAEFGRLVPACLRPVNGFGWSGADPAARLARLVLEELGIEDSQRRVFISHKRDDGLGAAEQLHDRLTHQGFLPFIDRFTIRTGTPVQPAIADALEEYAFLLLVETPLAHTSDWVFDEVEYALSHTMGTLILSWPENPTPVPGSKRLPRFYLGQDDLTADDHGYDIFRPEALDVIVGEVEAAHAQGLVRRRRMLVNSIEEAALAGGCSSCVPLPGWRLQVSHPSNVTIVGVAPRLPTVVDLQTLDRAKMEIDPGSAALLVHSARMLPDRRRSLLQWAVGDRELVLTPENAIGAHWQCP